VAVVFFNVSRSNLLWCHNVLILSRSGIVKNAIVYLLSFKVFSVIALGIESRTELLLSAVSRDQRIAGQCIVHILE
jgi:uncharacterized membrane protein YpjA